MLRLHVRILLLGHFFFKFYIFLINKIVKEAAEILSKAKRPVILIGSQATLPPIPSEKLRESLEVTSSN